MNMKKTGRKVAGILAFALLVLSLSFTGCSHGSELETYEVTFESNGGSSVQAQTVVEDSLVAEPKDPAKDGFTFGGWYTDAECTTAFDFTAKIEEDLTLYAKWNEVEKADNQEEEQKEEEQKEEDKSAEVNKAVNVVSFETAGGTAIPAQKLEKGSKASKPKDPEKEGYTFGGWLLDDKEFDFNLVVPSNITLFAKWTKNVYTVTFDLVLPPESAETKNPTQKVAFEDKATLPAKPEREDGFTVVGWYTNPLYGDSYKFDVDTPITKDTTVYAKWNAPSGKYIVRFITNTYDEKNEISSTEVTSQIVESGETAEEPAATKAGYTFDGWYTQSSYSSYYIYDFATTITSERTLYARWRKNPEAKVVVTTIDSALELKNNSNYTITIKEQNGQSGFWFIDGVSYSSSTYPSITINPENYGKGIHVVMLRYSKDSIYYNANLEFEIQ